MNEEVKIVAPQDFSVEYQDTKKNLLKRVRSENWSEVDKELLKELVQKRKKCIENKNTDTNTNKMKKQAWLDLQNDFNSLCSCEKRTVPQLKSQWSTIKIQAKKVMSEHRAKLKQTGGGEAPSDIPILGSDIAVWLPNEFVVDTNVYDSDNIFTKESATTSKSDVTVEIPPTDSGNELSNQKGPMKTVDQNKTPLKIKQTCNLVDFESEVPDSSQKLPGTKEAVTEQKLTPFKKKKTAIEKSTMADDSILKIANFDIECRKELHNMQIETEKKE